MSSQFFLVSNGSEATICARMPWCSLYPASLLCHNLSPSYTFCQHDRTFIALPLCELGGLATCRKVYMSGALPEMMPMMCMAVSWLCHKHCHQV
jgi:hypothetical protein